jgi:hypothetical protein
MQNVTAVQTLKCMVLELSENEASVLEALLRVAVETMGSPHLADAARILLAVADRIREVREDVSATSED